MTSLSSYKFSELECRGCHNTFMSLYALWNGNRAKVCINGGLHLFHVHVGYYLDSEKADADKLAQWTKEVIDSFPRFTATVCQ